MFNKQHTRTRTRTHSPVNRMCGCSLLRARKEIRNRFNASFCVLDTNYDSSSFTVR